MKIKHISIIGGGASGLFAAIDFLQKGYQVSLYEKETTVGKKLLLAGHSGLNLSNTLPHDEFCTRYGKDTVLFSSLIQDFSRENLQNWLSAINIEVFVGSSGKIFPISMTADNLLNTMKDTVYSSKNCTVYTGWRFSGFDGTTVVCSSSTEDKKICPPVIFALGGASYKGTGSDGLWANIFQDAGIHCNPFKPSNCGFEVQWSEHFRKTDLPQPIKNCEIFFEGKTSRGAVMITEYGIEGKCIYELSRELRDSIEEKGNATIAIDFFPDSSAQKIQSKLFKERKKQTLSNFLRKTLSIEPMALHVLYEQFNSKELEQKLKNQPELIKKLSVQLTAIRSIEEAISSSGGVSFEELTNEFMLLKKEGIYCIGEMIDWEAPTGGYLLHGCFATAARVCKTIQDQHE